MISEDETGGFPKINNKGISEDGSLMMSDDCSQMMSEDSG